MTEPIALPPQSFNRDELLLYITTTIPDSGDALNREEYRHNVLAQHLETLLNDFDVYLKENSPSLVLLREGEQPIASFYPAGEADSDSFVSYVKLGLSEDPDVQTRENAIVQVMQLYNKLDEKGTNTGARLNTSTDESVPRSEITYISPNINIGSSQGNALTGGGPGAFPIAITEQAARDHAGFAFTKEFDNARGSGTGAGVTVAVFDNYCQPATYPSNCLYTSLKSKIQNKAKLYIVPSPPTQIPPGQQYLRDYPHPVTDHGVFVAGIIHSIAPDADIRMYPMLDDFGVGGVFELMSALSQLQSDIASGKTCNKVVINMSFVMTIFTSPYKDLLIMVLDFLFKQRFAAFDDFNENASNAEVYIVAAVGNERRNAAQPAPPPEFPANYDIDNVIGVSAAMFRTRPNALDEPGVFSTFDTSDAQNVTIYSNAPETRPEKGFITFGGEAGMNGALRQATQLGIIGIYLNPLPKPGAMSASNLNYLPNPSGWARWAGTSFATPIISGALALCLSSGQNTAAMRIFNNANPTVFPVWQNQPLSHIIDECNESYRQASD